MPTSSSVLNPAATLHQRLSAACARLPFRLALFAGFALVLAWPQLSTAAAMNLFRDAQVLMPYEHNAARTVLDYLQAPLWDPYYCGGVYALGTPQGRFVSPTFLLSLLFGTLRAESLTVFAMVVVGLEGTWRYCTSRGASALGALLAAPVFAASGVFASAPHLGWINFFGFQLVPWALSGVRGAARGRPRDAVVGAVFLAWIVGFGGTYAAPMVALLCVFEALEGLIEMQRARRPLTRALGVTVMCAALAVGLALVRLWPVAETLTDAPRVIADAPTYTWRQVWEALTGHTERTARGGRWEHGYFMVGLAALPVAAVGLARWKAVPVAALGALATWTATGYAYGWSPFLGLRRLPLFSVLRYPERYLVFVALVIAVLAAWGITRAETWAMRRPRLWFAVGLLGIALGVNAAMQVQNHYRWAEKRSLVPPPPKVDRPFQQARGTRWALGYYAPMSRGSLSCWDAYPIPMSPQLRGDLPHDEYLAEDDAGSVSRRRWSPNRLDLDVQLQRPARLRINQNWHPGWRANIGQVVSDDGLLAIDLPAGSHDLTVRFVPRSAVGGALGSILAAIAAVWIWRKNRRESALSDGRAWVVHGAWVAAPFAVLLLVRAVVSEPGHGARSVRGPSGEAVVADELPPAAKRLDVQYASDVTLVASSLDAATVARGGTLTLELDWRTGPAVPRGLGVFVHVQPEAGAFLNRDHNLLSSTMELSDAPAGKILRDAVTIAIPPDAKPGRWTAWVGLWRSRGDGTRVPVVSNGTAQLVDGRINAGTFVVQ